jgi:hypothetical protein
MNAREWGLYSSDVVVAELGETKEDYEVCRQGFVKAFNPEDAVEEAICDDVVTNWWRRRRVRRSESDAIRASSATSASSMLSGLLKESKSGDDLESLPVSSGNSQAAESVLAISSQMSRAETRYDRGFYRAVSTLWTIKALKAKIGLAADSMPQLPASKGDSGES